MLPHHPKTIKDDLNSLISNLIEKGICDDSNFSVVKPNGKHWEVTFSGAEYISIALGDIEYKDIYSELHEKRSYNAKLIDGGLLQLMYLFNENQLVQHRLAFYPSPNLRPFQEDSEAYMRDELFLEITKRRIIPFPLRFDFDNRDGIHIDTFHPRSHLTLGDAKGCRIPVTAPLTPRWFIEFILRNFYHTKNYNIIEKLPNHRIHFSQCITENERNIVHMSIPTGK